MTNEEFQRIVLEKFEKLENMLLDMEAHNANRHIELDSKLATIIEDNKSLQEIIGEHETAIRTLRRKAI